MSISVVIPTYNGARFIKSTLRSVLSQQVLPDEIIVVDDASTDATTTVVGHLLNESPVPIELIRCGRNSGSPSAPMNIGINRCHSDYIAVVDQDDILVESKIENELRVLEQDRRLSVACSFCASVDEPDLLLQSDEVRKAIGSVDVERNEYRELDGEEMLVMLLQHGCFPIGFPGFTFRKSDWEAKGGIDESLKIADHDFLCWLATRGAAAIIEKVGYLRRFHDRNLSGNRLVVGRDFVEVVARYLTRLRPESVDIESLRSVRGVCLGIGYAMRDAGSYVEAFRCAHVCARIWGWDRELCSFVAKLLPHRCLRHLVPQQKERGGSFCAAGPSDLPL